MALQSPDKGSTAGRLRPYPLRIAPVEGESLPGFVLRLAQRNRMSNGKGLRDDIGLRNNQNEWTDENFRRLAALSGQPEDALRRLHHPLRADDTVQFKTGVVDKLMLERWVMRYCPICLDEQGYHQSIWFLRFVTVCLRHGARLIERCPACSRELRWYRPKFLECVCKAPLPLGPILAEETVPADELSGIRLLYEKCGVDHGGGSLFDTLPDAIRGLDLGDFISFLWLVGGTRDDFKSHKSHAGFLRTPDPDAHLILRQGVDLASDWPRRFHQWLAQTRQAPTSAGQASGLRKQFPLFWLKLRAIRSPVVLAIFQEAFLAFATDNGIYAHPTETLFVPRGSRSATRMISVTEAGRLLNVSAATAQRLAREQGWIDPARGEALPKAVPEDVVRRFATHFQSGITIRTATERLKVDHPTMMALLESGIIGRRRGAKERRRKGSFAWNITEADITQFQQRIDDAIRPFDDGTRRPMTSLQAINQRRSSHGLGYAALLRAVLDGGLVPRGRNATRGPAGLLFDTEEAQRFCAASSSDPQLRMTSGRAAAFLGISPSYIHAAVHLGLIQTDGRDEISGGHAFTPNEVERFGRHFRTVRQLAQQYGRPLRSMTAALKAAGIASIHVESGAFRTWRLYSVEELERNEFAKFIRTYKTYRERRRRKS